MLFVLESAMANYVVNSLLWYLVQRMKQLHIDMICKMVVKHYSSMDIENAKELLFKNFPEDARPKNLRKKSRQGAHKLGYTVKDMIDVLHEMSVTNNFTPPVFVTADCNFPSLDLSNVDAVTMSSDINELKEEVATLKADKLSDKIVLDEIKMSLRDIHSLLDLNKPSQVANDKLGLKTHKTPPTYAGVVASQNLPVNKSPSATNAKNCDPINLYKANDTEWKLIEIKKSKSKPKIGKNENSSLKVVKKYHKPTNLFVSRFHPETTQNEIELYAKDKFSQLNFIEVTKLKTKYDTYSSFKLTIEGIPLNELFKEDNWPKGVFVKRFYTPKVSLTDDTGSNLDNSIQS